MNEQWVLVHSCAFCGKAVDLAADNALTVQFTKSGRDLKQGIPTMGTQAHIECVEPHLIPELRSNFSKRLRG